ncbi:MAG: hypothetical protein ACN6PJ_22970 [Achromobacter sp.]|uniref:hypothetical protein n=1 Tax=Achromobacter sp. TaxID=134375 RepID=UPI003D04D018
MNAPKPTTAPDEALSSLLGAALGSPDTSRPAAVQTPPYGSPYDVAQRIRDYIGRHGRENTATLLLYEAMNALRRPAPDAGDRTAAARDVLAERQRQIEVEGMKNEVDDNYKTEQLPCAAASYILHGLAEEPPAIWPWTREWWKPRDARSNYVRACALILAEIERLDRAALSPQPGARKEQSDAN